MRLRPLGLCAAVLLTGCGADEAPPADAGPTASATATPDVEEVVEPVGEGSTDESVAVGDGPAVTLTDVRLAAHGRFDRVVFELAGEGEAGWRVAWTDDPRAQGSGAPVQVPEDAVLGITLSNIALPGDAPDGVAPWGGASRLTVADAAVLDALVEDTLSEGRYSFFAGLDARRPFAVAALDSPQRIVVDLLAEEPVEPERPEERCESPAGFAISYPEEWSVNPGTEVPACTRFAPDTFTVPPASDARVAPVSVRVEGIPFDQVATTGSGEVLSRDETTVDGRPAVRIERVTAGQGLWPEGVPITSVVVDLGAEGGDPRTLVVDTVGLPRFDYPRNVDVLDRMVATLTIGDAG
ncbi:AMIN-like domain-containing (lipo)protein [Blastococcus sp. SYSU DS0533]